MRRAPLEIHEVLRLAGEWSHPLLLGAGVVAALTLIPLGCADPCVDDGLGQKSCPGQTDAGGTADGTDVDTNDDSTETGDGGCSVLDVQVEAIAPTVVVVVDRSSSMTAEMGPNAETRWDVLESVLVDPGFGVVTTLESTVRYGMSVYANDGTTCPTLDVEPADLNNANDIAQLYASLMPAGDTPTGEALTLVADALDADPAATGDRIMVLATDGEPDTCAMPNPQEGQPEALAAVEYAYGLGIRTFVIGVGDQNTTAHMQNMANAGVGVMQGEPDAEFYVALDPDQLAVAFAEVLANARHCKLSLSSPLTEAEAAACTLTVDGSPVTYGDPDGWELDAPDRAELVGAACEGIQGDTVAASLECPC